MKKQNPNAMRKAGRIVTEVLDYLREQTKPGVFLPDLDRMAGEKIRELGATSYDKGYHPKWAKDPYPAEICICVNFGVAHCIPLPLRLREGDIVKYDVGVKVKDGLLWSVAGDAGITVPVGKIQNKEKRLIRYTKKALDAAIAQVKAGVPIYKISEAIERTALLAGYHVVKEYGGHTIGHQMHEEPRIPNALLVHGFKDYHKKLEAGQVICIEPIIAYSDAPILYGDEGDTWSLYKADGNPVAFFEKMIMVTEDGYEDLTPWRYNESDV